MRVEQIITKKIMEFDKYANSYLMKFKLKSFFSKAMIYGVLNGGKRLRPFLVISLSNYLKIKKSN